MKKDGITAIGARCTEEDCDWGPLGTDEPSTWRLVESFRREHEDETGHTVTVEAVKQRTILADDMDMYGQTLEIAEKQGIEADWICPECERSAEELEATKRCPDCDEDFRQVFP